MFATDRGYTSPGLWDILLSHGMSHIGILEDKRMKGHPMIAESIHLKKKRKQKKKQKKKTKKNVDLQDWQVIADDERLGDAVFTTTATLGHNNQKMFAIAIRQAKRSKKRNSQKFIKFKFIIIY